MSVRAPGRSGPRRRRAGVRTLVLLVALAAGPALPDAGAGPSDLPPAVQGLLGIFPVIHGADHQSSPALAYNPSADEFLAVWMEGPFNATNLIRARIIRRTPPFEPQPATLGPVRPVRDAGALEEVNDPAVAYDPAEDVYLVVWRETVGGTDTIQASRLGPDGTVLLPGLFRVDAGPCADSDPNIAHNPVSGEWLVIWVEDDSVGCVGTGLGVNARRVLADGSMPDFPVDVSANDSLRVNDIGIAHAGGPSPSVNEYLVVYSLVDEAPNPDVEVIRARRVSGAGAPQGAEFDVAGGGEQFVEDAGVAYDPRSRQFLIVWRFQESVIEGRLLDRASGGLGPRFFIGDASSADEPTVATSPTGPPFVVAWEANRDVLDPDDEDIFAQWIGADGRPVGPEYSVSRQPGDEDMRDETHRNVACAGDGTCLILWVPEDEPNSSDNDISGRFLFAPSAAHFAPTAHPVGP